MFDVNGASDEQNKWANAGGGSAMSEDEIRRQRGMLLAEHEEAEGKLAALKEKATRIGRNIQEFGRMLEKDPATRIYISGQLNHNLPIERLDEPKYRNALSFEAAIGLADEIRSAIATEKDLADRLKRHP
jgi:hypothetical protein